MDWLLLNQVPISCSISYENRELDHMVQNMAVGPNSFSGDQRLEQFPLVDTEIEGHSVIGLFLCD